MEGRVKPWSRMESGSSEEEELEELDFSLAIRSLFFSIRRRILCGNEDAGSFFLELAHYDLLEDVVERV